jgi:hypothetical protein
MYISSHCIVPTWSIPTDMRMQIGLSLPISDIRVFSGYPHRRVFRRDRPHRRKNQSCIPRQLTRIGSCLDVFGIFYRLEIKFEVDGDYLGSSSAKVGISRARLYRGVSSWQSAPARSFLGQPLLLSAKECF